MFHVILLNPEIPPNTGNIIRLCANSGCTLHLVRPCTFDLNDRRVRRAGLDYAQLAAVHMHANLAACLASLPQARLFSIETGADRRYSDAGFLPGDALLFGSETRGLPPEVMKSIHPFDDYLLARSRVGPVDVAETDLFEGVESAALRR